MWLSRVVFPAPRKPVRIVTGMAEESASRTGLGAVLVMRLR
jgi:hypothetical protein